MLVVHLLAVKKAQDQHRLAHLLVVPKPKPYQPTERTTRELLCEVQLFQERVQTARFHKPTPVATVMEVWVVLVVVPGARVREPQLSQNKVLQHKRVVRRTKIMVMVMGMGMVVVVVVVVVDPHIEKTVILVMMAPKKKMQVS